MEPVALLQELIRAPGPPGQEEAVRDLLIGYLRKMKREFRVDAKGNLIVDLGAKPRVVVTAHMDEIAMITRAVGQSGRLGVGALGGLYPWKLGEGPEREWLFTRIHVG